MLKAKGHKVTLVSRKPGLDRITWVCPASGSMRGRPGLVERVEASPAMCAFSNRMSWLPRGCPPAMPLSTWQEKTSSTPSEGQPGPEADILEN